MLLINELLLFNNYFGQNMRKMRCFEKLKKKRPALGAPPPGPCQTSN